jgi:TolB-like protein
MRWWLLLTCLLTTAFAGAIAGVAHADAPKRVAVLEFAGAGSSPKAARQDIVKALSKQSDLKVVAGKQLDSTARKLGVSLDSDRGLVRVAEQLQISAYVRGEVEKGGKKGMRITLNVLHGRDARSVSQQRWDRKKREMRRMGGTAIGMLTSAISESEAPAKRGGATPALEEEEVDSSDAADEDDEDEDEPQPKPVPVAAAKKREKPPARSVEVPAQENGFEGDGSADTAVQEEEEPAQKAERGDLSPLHPALIAQVGLRTMWRHLSYDGGTTLATYENKGGSPAVMAALSAQWYPLAHLRGDFVSNLGLDVDFDYALGLKSTQGGRKVSTSAYETAFGAIVRIPLPGVELRARTGYVRQVFDADVEKSTQLPAVAYGMLRFGAGAALLLGDRVALDANLAYLLGLSTGDLESDAFAPGAKANAFEVGAGLSVAFKEVYGVRLAADYRSYGQDFGSANSLAVMLPSSGTDSYLRTTLAFIYRMPGVVAGPKEKRGPRD